MLEYYFKREKARAQLAHNYLASCLEATACQYHAQDYPVRYVQGLLRSMAHFGDWLEEQAILPEHVTIAHARTFFTHFIPPKLRDEPHKATKKRRCGEHMAVITAVTWLQDHYAQMLPPTPVQRTVEEYADHLRRNRGLCDGTIYLHCLRLEAVLTCWFGYGEIRITEITTERILAYLDALPSTKSNAQRRGTCTALRGYFRFVEMQGIPTQHLCTVIPILPSRRAALSPTVLTPDDLHTLLHAVDRSTAMGKRTYAAILCLSDLGMRVGDVARLSLDDIDWRHGTIRIANHKQGRPFQLPLPTRVGEALAEYLAHGRPPSTSRAVFLHHARPVGTPATVHALKSAVWRAWDDSGLHGAFSGTHILRHSAATRLKQEGVPLKAIADVLGHASLQTTVLYAQIDLPALRKTAQPWPGGAA